MVCLSHLGAQTCSRGGLGGPSGCPWRSLGGPWGRGWGVQEDLGGLKWVVGGTRGPFEEQGGRKRGFAKSLGFFSKTIHLATWRVGVTTQNQTKGNQRQKIETEDSEKRAWMAKRDQKRGRRAPMETKQGEYGITPTVG